MIYLRLQCVFQCIFVIHHVISSTISFEFDIGRMYDTNASIIPIKRINPGYGRDHIDERRQQNCPGMIGPLDDNKYYCRGKEYGYCDIRSGTCYCNNGYAGLSCQKCISSHIQIGTLCYPRKFCPNDCSYNGKCDYITGLCNCYNHREGVDCSIKKCTKYSKYCTSCNDNNCLGCIQGYSVNTNATLGKQCLSCTRFDPRCFNCNNNKCLDCIDLLLTSISRLGGSRREWDTELPPDEIDRQLSITVPIGSQQTDAFDEAENYFLVEDNNNESSTVVPLNQSTVKCDQGLSFDSTYTCASTQTSHVVCGHYGFITFSSPTYQVNENEKHVRLNIRRSGGGVGKVSVMYDTQHITTNDSDLTSTAQYTSSQYITFNPSEIQKSFLITINDDRLKENNETFLVFLSDPTNGSSLGNQYRTIVTIIDDDDEKTCSNLSQIIPSSSSTTSNNLDKYSHLRAFAGVPSTFIIQSKTCINQTMYVGGNHFTSILTEINNNDNDNDVSNDMNYNNAASLHKGRIIDQGDGTYICTMNTTKAGKYYMNVYQLIPGGLVGQYYNNAELSYPQSSSLDKVRIDSIINFTWGYGRITNYGINYVSIRWEGFIKSNFTEIHTFFAKDFDENVRIWIDGKILIDNWSTNINVLNQVDYFLNASMYYHMLIEYRDREGSAKAKLLWSSEHTPKEVIPSSALFYKEHIRNSPFKYAVISGDANAEKSIVSGVGISKGIAGKKHYFWIDSRDIFGNSRGDYDVGFNGKFSFHDKDLATARSIDGFYGIAELISDDGGGIGDDIVIVSISYDFLNRRYEAWFRPTRSGFYLCNITLSKDILNYNSVAGGSHIFGSPFTVKTLPDIAFAPESHIANGYWERNVTTCQNSNFTCLTNQNGVAGIEQMFTIISKDLHRNFRDIGGDDWEIIIRSKSKEDSYGYGHIQDFNNGEYNAYFTPTVSGWNELSILLHDSEHAYGSPVDIFVHPNIAYGPSCFVKEDITAKIFVATTTNSFFVQLVDFYNNDLFHHYETNVEIEIVNDEDNIASTTGNIMFVDSGSFIVYIVPKKSGLNTLIIKVNGKNISGSPFDMQVVTGESNALSSTAVGVGLTKATAGIAAEFFVFYRDIEGNIELNEIDNLELKVELKLLSFSTVGNAGLDVDEIPLVIGQSTYQDNGEHLVRYNVTVSGIYEMSVTLRNSNSTAHELKQHIHSSPFMVSISPATTNAQKSLVIGQGIKEGFSGKSSRIEILLRDSYENFVQNDINYKLSMETILINRHQQNWEVTGEEYADGKKLTTIYKQKEVVTDHNDGIYLINYSPRVSGEYEMRFTLEMPGGLIGTYFKAPDFDENHLLFERTDSMINMTFHESGLTAEIKNDFNAFSVEWNGFIQANHSEEYLIGIECDQNGKASVAFNDIEILEWNSCAGYREGSTLMKSLEKVKLRVRYSHNIDQNFDINDAFISLTWFNPSAEYFSLIPSSNLYHEKIVSNSIYNPIIYPGKVFAPKSTVIGKSLKEAIAGERHQFTVECRDEFGYVNDWGNLQFNGGSNIFPYAKSVNTLDNNIGFTVVDNKNGTYSVEYIPFKSGSLALYIFVSNATFKSDNLNFEPEGNELQVKGSPFNLLVLPGETNASTSHIEDRLDTLVATAGKEKTIKVYAKDTYGNPKKRGGDRIAAKVTFFNDGVFLFDCDVKDNHNGTYLIPILPKNHSGTHHLHVSFTNDEGLSNSIMGSPFTLDIKPGDASASRSHLLSGAKIVGDSMWKFRTNSTKIRRFQIITKDKYGNILLKGGDNFVLEIQGERDGPENKFRLVTNDNGDGVYQSAYHLSKKGTYEMHISLATKKGGLLGKYYRNRYFSGATMTRIDEKIDFNWGYGAIIPNSAKDFVSIHWSGYLRVPYTEVYFFELLANEDDSAKLQIEDSTILDTRYSSEGSFNCTGNMLHKINIEYVEMDGAASIILLWSSRRTPRDKVPSSYLFNQVEPIKGSPFEIIVY